MNYNRIGEMLSRLAVIGLVSLLPGARGYCQLPAEGADEAVDARMQAVLIDSVIAAYNDHYVFPDAVGKIAALLREKHRSGAYANLARLSEFADVLMGDLMQATGDGHAYVIYMKERSSAFLPIDSLSPQELEKLARESAYTNNGFQRVERLDGNVGYLDLRQFCHPAYAGGTAMAAMNFLGNCDAIIVDLRENGGGDGEMGNLLSSFFFKEQKRLNDMVFASRTEQNWTDVYVPGQKLPDVPLYILMSARSFSAAEGFTFGLQNAKRAVVVGEKTRGGGHTIKSVFFPSLHIMVCVPNAETRNPEDGATFFATGITPDIPVPADRALDVAHMEALRQILAQTIDEDKKKALGWTLGRREALASPAKVDAGTMKKYAGKYGERTITLENGQLYYQRRGRPKYRLIPMSQDTFVLAETENLRVKFVLGPEGKAGELIGIYSDGTTDSMPRSSK
jgi:retinol-binding protein 3